MMSGSGVGSGMGGGMGGGAGDMFGGLQQLFGGLFGNSGAPYEDAMKQFQKYFGEAKNYQNPFFKAGENAIPGMQDWLNKMKDPSGFINNIMGKYQESPMARNLQQSAMRAGTNAGSASGMTGSTPMMQQMQQNAGQISSMDQNNFLQNVLGVNKDYGSGMSHMMDTGSHAADQISQLLQNLGMQMGSGAYGKRAGEQQDQGDIFSGLLNMLMGGGKMFMGGGM